MARSTARLVPLLLAVACGGSGTDTQHGDTWVTALVDGVEYEGDSQGAAFLEGDGGDTELMLFPADPISGSLFDWNPGETGTWNLVGVQDEVDILLFYFDENLLQYVGGSGSFTIETWTDHEPENAADPRIGFIEGGFEGVFTNATSGNSVEITGGDFGVMVTQQMEQ